MFAKADSAFEAVDALSVLPEVRVRLTVYVRPALLSAASSRLSSVLFSTLA